MRKSILTIVLAVAYLSTFATSTPDIKEINYVETDNSVGYFTKIRIGMNDRLVAKTTEGEKTVFKMENVKTYRVNGKEFHRKFLVISGTQRVERVFMQRICTCSGLSLFKLKRSNADQVQLSDFYVYRDNVVLYKLNKDNYKEVISSFFPRVNMLIWN